MIASDPCLSWQCLLFTPCSRKLSTVRIGFKCGLFAVTFNGIVNAFGTVGSSVLTSLYVDDVAIWYSSCNMVVIENQYRLLSVVCHSGHCRTDFSLPQKRLNLYTSHESGVYVLFLISSLTAVLWRLLQP
jgi:hypothetical protein